MWSYTIDKYQPQAVALSVRSQLVLFVSFFRGSDVGAGFVWLFCRMVGLGHGGAAFRVVYVDGAGMNLRQ